MDILYLLVPLSVVLAFLAGAVFWLALGGGQFDDLDGPALKVLADDDRAHAPAPEGEFDPDQMGAGPAP